MVLASVVIPAHDEEQVVGRCLQSLTAGAEPGELEIVVVCNGCTDRTAEVTRRAFPGATVLEIPTASKIAALNQGDASAVTFPRFYVDADVEMDIEAVRATVEVLSGGAVLCAAPAPRFELTGRSGAIRGFYQVWERMPYLAGPVVGNGVYALSAEGRARFGPFPDLTADDQFVMLQFRDDEREAVRTCSFTVHPPRDLTGLVRIRTRAYRGNAELARSGLARTPPPGSGGSDLARVARDPSLLPGVVAYAAINAVAKARARRAATGWERDESSRHIPD